MVWVALRILERLGFLRLAHEFSPQTESFAKWWLAVAAREFGGRIFRPWAVVFESSGTGWH
ncbi:MAG: hypothetical protein K8R46_11395, partial [Pirellulales bacterium]|nr:hypothetical protein [Pirellulales bacterium]